jgi:WD40 repeat protein
VGFPPTGPTLLVTGHKSGDTYVWNARTGEGLHLLAGHTAGVLSVACVVLTDGRILVATGGRDHAARIWDGCTGVTMGAVTGHHGAVNSVTWVSSPRVSATSRRSRRASRW